jgi:hypothetical protein
MMAPVMPMRMQIVVMKIAVTAAMATAAIMRIPATAQTIMERVPYPKSGKWPAQSHN